MFSMLTKLLLSSKEMEVVYALRKAMSTKSVADVTEELIEQMIATKNNEEFIDKMELYLRRFK